MPARLLLHACCAPCLTQCAMVLSGRDSWEGVLAEKPDYAVSVFYDNPNIGPPEEYEKRRAEVVKLVRALSPDVPLELLPDSSPARRGDWQAGAVRWKDEPERGQRCSFCYRYRLEEAFRVAREWSFDAVATTLTLSPLKNTPEVNRIGEELSAQYGIRYLVSDFKKNGGFRKSIALTKKYGIFRQNYCGCVYSVRDPKKKAQPLSAGTGRDLL